MSFEEFLEKPQPLKKREGFLCAEKNKAVVTSIRRPKNKLFDSSTS